MKGNFNTRGHAAMSVLLMGLLPYTVAIGADEIQSSVISGGGGSSSAGRISITGTLGQAIGPQTSVPLTDNDSTSSGKYSLTSGFIATLTVVLPEPDEGYLDWMAGLEERQRPPESQMDPDAEPSRDGMSNLMKYALGLMPMTPSAQAIPRVVTVPFLDDDGETRFYLGIEFERSLEANVVFTLETSEDLAGWEPISYSLEIINPAAGANRERVQMVSTIAVENHGQHYVRLHISMP